MRICGNIYKQFSDTGYGEVSEWFKELVLKTSDPARDRGFESHPLRQFNTNKSALAEIPKW